MKTLVKGKDFYYNEQGLMVLTRAYHLERGRCCGNGCRHCPFDYVNVRKTDKEASRKNKESR